jgi:hypothetical protein
MNKHSEIYFYNYEKFIIISRPKYGSRILRLYWEIYLKKVLGNNLYINRLSEPSFQNLYALTDLNAEYYPYSVIFSNTDGKFETIESTNTNFFKPDTHPDMVRLGMSELEKYSEYEFHREKATSFLYEVNSTNLKLLRKIWNGEQIDKPVYIIYRNPENHFKSGLLQDVGYHEFINNKEKCFEIFDVELNDSGYVGNHRNNYLSILMPHIYHLNNLHFFNLDGTNTIDFNTIFKAELDDASYYESELFKIGGMVESEHRTESSHKQAYPIVSEYFRKYEINMKFHQFYFADNIWYNKLIRDSRNLIQTRI